MPALLQCLCFMKSNEHPFSFPSNGNNTGVLFLKESGSKHRQANILEWLNVDAFNLDGTVCNLYIWGK